MLNQLNNNTSFEEWSKSLENMDFDHYSVAIRDKILASDDMDKLSKQFFSDCFDYMKHLYDNNKELDLKLLKIHLELVKDYKNIKIDEFIRVMLLLSYCGFNIKKC